MPVPFDENPVASRSRSTMQQVATQTHPHIGSARCNLARLATRSFLGEPIR